MAVKQSYTMEELCVSFITRNRLYACILSKLNKLETSNIPTMGVGFSPKGKLILCYNPKFLASMTLAQAQSVLEHEVLHVFFRHLYRIPIDKSNMEMKQIANIAMDMAINQYLTDLPKGCVYPETYNLPKEQYAEWYFEELKKINEQQKKDQQNGQGGQGQKGNQVKDGQTIDDHEMWDKVVAEDGQMSDAAGNENCDIEHEVDKIVRQAAKECNDSKSIGDLPQGVRKELEALKNPKKKHDWKRELKVFVNSVLTLSKRLSQKRVNRRFLETVDYILPGKKKNRKPKLMLARDTSGSVFNEDMQLQFLNEMITISKHCEIIVVDCDTEIHQKYTVKNIKDFKGYEGGGGTSFVPVFEEARKSGVDGIIYLTDTYGDFPNVKDIGKFSTKTIWVTINQGKVEVPFGKHVNIEQED